MSPLFIQPPRSKNPTISEKKHVEKQSYWKQNDTDDPMFINLRSGFLSFFPTPSWHGGWSNWWDLQSNVSDPSKPYFVLKYLIFNRIDVRIYIGVSNLNAGNLIMEFPTFLPTGLDLTPPENSRGVVFAIGTRRYPKLERRNINTNPRSFELSKLCPPKV